MSTKRIADRDELLKQQILMDTTARMLAILLELPDDETRSLALTGLMLATIPKNDKRLDDLLSMMKAQEPASA